MKTSILLSIAALLCFTTLLAAQSIERSVIAAGGTTAQAGNIQLEYTIGETAVQSLESATILLTQGFHQGELMTTTGLSGLPVDISYKVYPNPVGETLRFSMDGPDLDFWVVLYDLQGRPLPEGRRQVRAFGHWQESFDLSQQASGTFLLVITDAQGRWLKSHKVIKP